MTGKEFMKAVANGRTDPLEILLGILKENSSEYYVIGGLAVNAYAEPVVSLDLDIVVVAEGIDKVCAAVQVCGLLVRECVRQYQPFDYRVRSPDSTANRSEISGLPISSQKG